MSTNLQSSSAVGLDVGTSRIVAAQRQDKDIQCETQLNAFVTIPFSKLTQSVLKKERIPHLVAGVRNHRLRRRSGAVRQSVPQRDHGVPCCAAF